MEGPILVKIWTAVGMELSLIPVWTIMFSLRVESFILMFLVSAAYWVYTRVFPKAAWVTDFIVWPVAAVLCVLKLPVWYNVIFFALLILTISCYFSFRKYVSKIMREE